MGVELLVCGAFVSNPCVDAGSWIRERPVTGRDLPVGVWLSLSHDQQIVYQRHRYQTKYQRDYNLPRELFSGYLRNWLLL